LPPCPHIPLLRRQSSAFGPVAGGHLAAALEKQLQRGLLLIPMPITAIFLPRRACIYSESFIKHLINERLRLLFTPKYTCIFLLYNGGGVFSNSFHLEFYTDISTAYTYFH
jgi:hypothetical protein